MNMTHLCHPLGADWSGSRSVPWQTHPTNATCPFQITGWWSSTKHMPSLSSLVSQYAFQEPRVGSSQQNLQFKNIQQLKVTLNEGLLHTQMLRMHPSPVISSKLFSHQLWWPCQPHRMRQPKTCLKNVGDMIYPIAKTHTVIKKGLPVLIPCTLIYCLFQYLQELCMLENHFFELVGNIKFFGGKFLLPVYLDMCCDNPIDIYLQGAIPHLSIVVSVDGEKELSRGQEEGLAVKQPAALKGQAVVDCYVCTWHACIGRVLVTEGYDRLNTSASQCVNWREIVWYQSPNVPLQGHIPSLLQFQLSSLLPSTTLQRCYPLFWTHNIHSLTHHHYHSIVMPSVLCDTPSGGSASQLASQTGGVPQRGCQSGASTPSLDYYCEQYTTSRL